MSRAERPSLAEWLSASLEEMSAVVRPRGLRVLFVIDGSQRHFLLSQRDAASAGGSLEEGYVTHAARAYVRAFELLFAHGIEVVLTPALYPPNFGRGDAYLARAAREIQFLAEEPFLGFYRRAGVRARLYGDHAFAPAATPARAGIEAVEERLRRLTPEGSRLLLYGSFAGSFTEEMIRRTAELTAALGRPPTLAELRKRTFPDGPEAIDIAIVAGWLRVGLVLPPLLDGGATDIYALAHLALDLDAEQLRRILYDHLFLRRAAPEDNASYLRHYSPAALAELAAHYDAHRGCVVGLGHLVGPGLWYAEHPHRDRDGAES